MSLQPSEYVLEPQLTQNCKCPECQTMFTVKDGYANFTYYKRMDTGQVKYGLVVFCTQECLLAWENPIQMYRA